MIEALLGLAHTLGAPEHDLAILGEGNVSARLGLRTMLVKASGHSLGTLGHEGVVECSIEEIMSAFEADGLTDMQARELLNASVVSESGKAFPSTETFMHAYLLSLPDVRFVGHTHPTPLLSLLCLEEAQTLAQRRLFPDEIVCCGPMACFVPYVAPGLELAIAIKGCVEAFQANHDIIPKTIWLQNHGLICLGNSPKEVEAASLMSHKAARVLLQALSSGRPVRFFTPEEVDHIFTWPDEHFRQKLMFDS